MESGQWSVFCLCAEWCGVCRDWRGPFESLADAHADVRFDWIDIEDEAEVMGDLEVETFPTVLICDAARVRFFGPVLPRTEALTSLLRSLLAQPASGSHQDVAVRALCERLRSRP